MVAHVGARPTVVLESSPIDTMRAIAVVMLVGYHVVGAAESEGLQIGYPDMLRLYADFFVDLRMPLFAFIAGYVYAMRAARVSTFQVFVLRKLGRLFVPAVIAALTMCVVANVMGNRFALPWNEMWKPLVQPFMHYWFLQSLLVIFLVFGLFDAVLRHRYTGVMLLCATVLYLSDFNFGKNVFSVNGALYLLPYFLLGVVFSRHATIFFAEAARLTLLLLLVLVACAFWNIQMLYETGAFSLIRRDVQSLGFGAAGCVLLMLWCPRLPLLERLSPYAFTIYLYHVFGTVMARMLANSAGITSMDARFSLGLLGGLAIPILLHEVMTRVPKGRELVLGNRV